MNEQNIALAQVANRNIQPWMPYVITLLPLPRNEVPRQGYGLQSVQAQDGGHMNRSSRLE